MSSIDFSPWFDVDQLALDGLPAVVFVYQVKTASRLVTYPSGRSAMLFYGQGAADEALFETVRVLRLRYPDDRLRLRFRPILDASNELNRLLARFEARFGSLPEANQTPA